MAELKKCPFCGGEGKINYIGTCIPLYFISCKECGCRQENSIHKETVTNAWNNRPTESEIRAKAISVMGMAMKEAYPTHKANYVEFDVFFRDVMLRVAEQLKGE